MSLLSPRPDARRPGRIGFTLIELLVVIAIIAILIGLLLPAVQKVRESANKAKCVNNLKQIGIAIHAYHGDYTQIPYDTYPGNTTWGIGGAGWGWLSKILPYIEQGNLYTLANLGSTPLPNFNANANTLSVVGTQIKTYLCPSDASSINARTDAADMPSGTAIGCTNYKGSSGSNWQWGTYQNAGPSGNSDGLTYGDGVFWRNGSATPLSFASITDGLSTTFFVGEDVCSVNQWAMWCYANGDVGTCSIPLNNALQTGQPGYNNKGDWPDVYSFRSRHTGGANFLMGDGSVYFCAQSINLTIYRQVSTRAGGEVATLP